MKKLLNKKLNFFLFFLVSFFSFFPCVSLQAQGSLEITFEPDPLFSISNFLPGDTATSSIKVENKSDTLLSIYVWPENVSDPADLANVLNLKIEEAGNTLFNNTLSNFFATSSLYLSDLAPNQESQYELSINFDITAGNEYQEKGLQFDFFIGSLPPEEEEVTPEEGVTVAVQAGGVGPSLEIFNIQVKELTENTATISWQTNSRATSQVIYSLEGESHDFEPGNPPLYGYLYLFPEVPEPTRVIFHTIELSNLASCSTYYFRAISRNLTIAISPEHNFTTLCPPEPEPEKAKEKEIIEERPREEKPREEKKEEITVPPLREKPKAPIEEVPKPEEKEVPQKYLIELPPEERKPQPSFFQNLLANIGNIFQELSGKFLCLPWWLLGILALYPLLKSLEARQKIKKEALPERKDYQKRILIIWLTWFLILIFLALFPYYLFRVCFSFWSLVLLLLATFLIWYFLRKLK